MSSIVHHGHEVDLDHLSSDIHCLGFELGDKDVVLSSVETSHKVVAEDMEAVEITLTLHPTTDSFLSGGYTVPFEHDA